MFAVGLSVPAPRQFTSVIVRPTLKNIKCILSPYHHLRCQATLSLRNSTGKRSSFNKSFSVTVTYTAHISSQHKLNFSLVSHLPGWPVTILRSHLVWGQGRRSECYTRCPAEELSWPRSTDSGFLVNDDFSVISVSSSGESALLCIIYLCEFLWDTACCPLFDMLVEIWNWTSKKTVWKTEMEALSFCILLGYTDVTIH